MDLSPDAAQLLRAAWRALAGPEGALDGVTVTGSRPGLLPSVVASFPAMLAAVAASTAAVSVADAARRRGAPEPVTLDARHVAVAARSERHARAPGVGGLPSFAPLSRVWPTLDGHVRTHANYPWHRERMLAVLGCPDDPAVVGAAVRERSTHDLEEAFDAAGALAFGVRTLSQWQAHPQGAAIAALPLAEVHETGGAGRPPGAGRALAGVRVLDLTRVIAGPVATRTLAAWGADVLRLDSPRLPENEDQCLDTLVGKRSALLDAAAAHDRTRLEELLGQADVVIQGYRPGALAALGLDAEALAQRHPHVSVVTLSAWGRLGPWSQRRGFDSLVQAATGLAALEGSLDAPGVLPAQVLDHATGYLAAAAAALSVAAVSSGGSPRRTTLSLAQTSSWLTSVAPVETPDLPEADPDVDRWLVDVPGPRGGVRVVSPPGHLRELTPGWASTTRYGGDAPAFRP